LQGEDNWRVPLREKAEIFERNLLRNHWIDGLYPSIVELPLDGGPVDQSTTGYSNVVHSVCWTANYLAGQAYRFAFTKDERVRRHAGRVLGAMIRCLEITGVRGLQARGYLRGHGESYEEREGSTNADAWHQGKGKYANLRWRGNPSHHNYSDAIHGYAAYYDLAANEEQKKRIRRAVRDLVGYWAFNNGLIRKLDGSISTHILGLTDGRTPNLRTIMAAAGLKAAHHITGEKAFEEEYEKLVEQFNFRGWERFPQRMRRRYGHDDAEHVFGHLDNLFRQEKDPELLGFYRKVLDALWENHRHDRQSLFTYIYLSLTPEYAERERALKEALWTLHTWPINRVFRPRMNSIRRDIKIVDGRASKPLPMYESPWDNEYQWKGSLYLLDGYLSRSVISLAVPLEDPMVIYAADERGDVYRSIDGGGTWRQTAQSLCQKVRFLAASRRIRFLFAGSDEGFYLSKTAGATWSKMPLPEDSGRPMGLVSDRENENILYAITDRGVFRSIDHGEAWLGSRWDCVTSELPPSHDGFYAVSATDPPAVYAILDGRAYFKLGDEGWRRGGLTTIPEYGRSLHQLLPDPFDPMKVYTATSVSYESLSLNLVFRSADGGRTWNNDLPRLFKRYVARYEAGLDLSRELRGELHGLTALGGDAILAATSLGVFRSTDGGENWAQSNRGLNIPIARSVFSSPASDRVFVGTPGGLYQSTDGGRTWQDANLILIFRSNIPREVGSAGFLDAYWMGRYHDFITEEEAEEDPFNWDMNI